MQSFEERYFFNRFVSSTCIASTKSGSLFIALCGNEVAWPYFDPIESSILICRRDLWNIPPNYTPTRLFSINHEDNCYLIISCTAMENGLLHLLLSYHMEEITNLTWKLNQVQNDFSLSFDPVHVFKVHHLNQAYLLISSLEGSLHAYELDRMGRLHRRSSTEDVRTHWNNRLFHYPKEVNTLITLQDCGDENQGVAANSDGLLIWSRTPVSTSNARKYDGKNLLDTQYLATTQNASNQIQTLPLQSPIPKQPIKKWPDECNRSYSHHNLGIASFVDSDLHKTLLIGAGCDTIYATLSNAVLYESSITAMSFYDTNAATSVISFNPSHCIECGLSEAVIVGTSDGCTCLTALNYSGAPLLDGECIVLCHLRECGPVSAITTGDSSLNGLQDVFIGFCDGTIVLCLRTDCRDRGFFFTIGWKIRLPNAVVSMSFGLLMSQSVEVNVQDDDLMLEIVFSPQQLVVQTDAGVLLFVASALSMGNTDHQENLCDEDIAMDSSLLSHKLNCIDAILSQLIQ